MDIMENLESLGYQVTEMVTSGEQAIQKAWEIKPDLILMDIILKGRIDGITAAAEIYNNLNIPIVYLTAHTDEKTLLRAKSTKPFGYIIKPFDRKDLQTTIEMAITRYDAERQIDIALKKEQELNLLKSNFISMVSHEFRTPMFTILLSAELLENYRSQWTEDKKLTHILRIQTAIKEMQELLEQVLTIGQAEAGKIDCQRKLIDLEKFCRELTEEMQLMSKAYQNIIFINENVLKNVCMDEKILRHIFTNLLSNAIKYSPEGSTIKFTLRCAEDNSQVTIFQVQDQGIGIPLEDQDHLFSTFHRCSNVGNISGTGLGLAIVKKSVEAHGGEINFESQIGVGTTFNVIIPC
jgi:signal transduction histidine kinase